ncbi:MAG: O-antigen ligase family protein [Rhodocyclaceae bacterium]|nr:O-antigen ligase family protein [Rhodocyclaceae bacterium]MDZ4215948.1 O-antigen ligase family protein [Rhodocyclaceae bacterium]
MASSYKEMLWAFWLAVLVFVFPIPGTIALRNLLLLVGVIALLWTGRDNLPARIAELRPAAWVLVALTAWITLHSVLFATDTSGAMDQSRSNWLNQILIAAIGAWAASQIRPATAGRAVVIALAAHMLWLLGHQAMLALDGGAWPFKATPFAGYDYHGMLISFLFALLAADRVATLLGRESPLGLGRHPGWILLGLSIAADISLQSRNSTLVDLLIAASAVLLLLSVRKGSYRSGIAALCAMAAIGTASFSFDSRWQDFREAVAIGWSSQSMYWLTNDPAQCPTEPCIALEKSAYFRIAWARQAIDMIGEHPLGIGFGHDSFGRAIEARHGIAGWGSSHSGWLDFALGVGLPGLALLLVAAVLAMCAGWQHFRRQDNGAGLVLAFFVGGYLFRGLLDGHLTGWRLGLFGFICGILITAMKAPSRRT